MTPFLDYMVHDWGHNRGMAQTAAPPLLPVFRSRLQGELLALVLGDPAGEWTAEELSRRTGHPRHTVANELRRLEEAGLFIARIIGRSKLVRANTENPGLTSLDRLRRRRNQAEYPNPTNYDPITVDEAKDAIEVANGCVSSADRLLQLDELGIF